MSDNESCSRLCIFFEHFHLEDAHTTLLVEKPQGQVPYVATCHVRASFLDLASILKLVASSLSFEKLTS